MLLGMLCKQAAITLHFAVSFSQLARPVPRLLQPLQVLTSVGSGFHPLLGDLGSSTSIACLGCVLSSIDSQNPSSKPSKYETWGCSPGPMTCHALETSLPRKLLVHGGLAGQACCLFFITTFMDWQGRWLHAECSRLAPARYGLSKRGFNLQLYCQCPKSLLSTARKKVPKQATSTETSIYTSAKLQYLTLICRSRETTLAMQLEGEVHEKTSGRMCQEKYLVCHLCPLSHFTRFGVHP